MKIGEFLLVNSLDSTTETKKTSATGSKDDDDFASVLQDELTGAGGTGSCADTSAVASTSAVSSVTEETDDDSSGLVGEIDSIITKLQSFEDALQSDASPKQVDEIISELGKMTGELQSSTATSTAGTSGTGSSDTSSTGTNATSSSSSLEDLSQEVQVASYMESVKWRRGDYL